MGGQRRKKLEKGFNDISHYFLSAAEADGSLDAGGTAGRQARENPPMLSDDNRASPRRSLQPMRRKENCASCAHLIARSGQPFQCRIYSIEHATYKVQPRETIELHEGHVCPYFMRVTSKQIEDILRSHQSSLSVDHIRDSAHHVEEKTIHEKTVTIEPLGGMTAEETLREELLRYLVDGYSLIDATVVLKQELSDERHSNSTSHRIHLRVRRNG